jgi:uncharacterized protein YjbI with pentapeptide repeats
MSWALAPEGMPVAPTSIDSAKNASKNLARRWHTGVMANPEHLAKLYEGVAAWNLWRKMNNTDIDLSGADLCGEHLFKSKLDKGYLSSENSSCVLDGAYLRGVNLSGADLKKANLSGADLLGANLHGTNLSRTHLHESDLRYSDLSEAYLSGADISMANLCNVSLYSTELDRTDFFGAIVGHTTFNNVDLSRTIGLETLIHQGPSSIGIDTIYKSKGKIPHVFLRGCGVPENFIEYMASLVGTGIEFYSFFISYSTKDQEFAERLHADLQAKGVRCWFAPHDMRSGKKVHEQIDEAIRVYDKLLLILSPASMQSEWVKTEISKARKREIKECKRILFPIRLCSFEALRDWECFDADAGKDSAREIREYFIPDFSNWKDHDSYRLAFDRLLKDLQGKAEPHSI